MIQDTCSLCSHTYIRRQAKTKLCPDCAKKARQAKNRTSNPILHSGLLKGDKVFLNSKVSKVLDNQIKEIADSLGISKSAIVRIALSEFLSQLESTDNITVGMRIKEE